MSLLTTISLKVKCLYHGHLLCNGWDFPAQYYGNYPPHWNRIWAGLTTLYLTNNHILEMSWVKICLPLSMAVSQWMWPYGQGVPKRLQHWMFITVITYSQQKFLLCGILDITPTHYLNCKYLPRTPPSLHITRLSLHMHNQKSNWQTRGDNKTYQLVCQRNESILLRNENTIISHMAHLMFECNIIKTNTGLDFAVIMKWYIIELSLSMSGVWGVGVPRLLLWRWV